MSGAAGVKAARRAMLEAVKAQSLARTAADFREAGEAVRAARARLESFGINADGFEVLARIEAAAPDVPGAVIAPLGGDIQGRRVWCELGEKRPPTAGEYYLSGAIPEVWQALGDMRQAFHIVRPTHYARRVEAWGRGERFPPAKQRGES